MIDKICNFLTNRIRKEMPDIDDERAEVINYGLQLIIGEIPKMFLAIALAFILGVGKYTLITLGISYCLGIFNLSLFTFISLLIYKGASGGVHLKTHLGCIIFTVLFYCGIPFISQYFVISQSVKYIMVACIWMEL